MTRPSVYGRYPRNGRTARELAERMGTSVRTAQRWTSEPREVFVNRGKQRREKIRELRSSGMSMRAIAAELGCSVGTVHNALKAQETS
ncbi:MAG: helix-turn-helix domain-containing protein [Actinomycetia bacterium]|nr:helix-turn-helix domain-containing protein [Actinomycetes bacterium]